MRREMLGSYAPATEIPEQARSDIEVTVIDGDTL
jgi:hypothetical protein